MTLSMADLKLYTLNTFTLGITTFSSLEMGLKVFLLVVSIGYTLTRWIKLKNTVNDK
tara:strand:- start:658 stop:828 length:171 start_codon:yes stop_codon:yes gene_type:complete